MNEKTPAIFLDTDVILDLLLKREPHFISARTLFARIETGLIQVMTPREFLETRYSAG